jgi:hypothetical protein
MGNRDFTIKKRHANVPPVREVIVLMNRGPAGSLAPQSVINGMTPLSTTFIYMMLRAAAQSQTLSRLTESIARQAPNSGHFVSGTVPDPVHLIWRGTQIENAGWFRCLPN